MKRPHRALLSAVFALAASAAGLALAAPEDLRSQRFYRVELIVFARPSVSEAGTREHLATPAPKPLPRGMLAFRDEFTNHPVPFTLETERMLRRRGVGGSDVLPGFLTLPGPTPPMSEDASAPAAEQILGEAPGKVPGKPTPSAGAASGNEALQPSAEAQAAQTRQRLEAELATALAADERALLNDSYRFEAGDLKALAPVLDRLERRYRILLAGGWQQPVPGRDAPQPLYLTAGDRQGDQFTLEGTVEVTVSRYLHFHTELKYYEPELGAYLVQLEPDEAAELTAEVPDADSPTLPLSAESATSTAEPTPAVPLAAEPVYERVLPEGLHFMELSAQRRMRSAELHYLDHPKFGVLVRIDPVAASPALAAAQRELDAFEE